jgi:hypothetical protein
MPRTPRLLASLLALATLAPFAGAQAPTLAKHGGAAPGTTTLTVEGTPGAIYAILFATSEQTTPLPTGATLAIPLHFLLQTFVLPGFFGVLDGSGSATASFTLNANPGVLDLVVSAQALQGPAFDAASKLVRITPQTPGTFDATLGTPALPVAGGVAVAADDGQLVLVGGSGPLAQAYDPCLEEFELAGAAFGVGLFAQSTALADGRVLFTGGLDATGQPTADAAVYDPAGGTVTPLAMGAPRAGHGASLLGDGRVLVTGGFVTFDLTDPLAFLTGVQSSTELFDPATDTFAPGPNMLEARALHTSTSLDNGGALVAGGLSVIPILNLPTISSTAYAFNPGLGTFGLPIFFQGARFLHAAAKLSDGRVLLAGGLTVDLAQFLMTLDPLDLVFQALADCQRFTPGPFGGSFTTVPGLSQPRAGAGIVALPGGDALIAGGADVSLGGGQLVFQPLADADRYDAAQTIAPTGAMSAPRFQPLLVPLSDGTVLAVGGGAAGAEVYQP